MNGLTSLNPGWVEAANQVRPSQNTPRVRRVPRSIIDPFQRAGRKTLDKSPFLSSNHRTRLDHAPRFPRSTNLKANHTPARSARCFKSSKPANCSDNFADKNSSRDKLSRAANSSALFRRSSDGDIVRFMARFPLSSMIRRVLQAGDQPMVLFELNQGFPQLVPRP
jgi:hypothetical protein